MDTEMLGAVRRLEAALAPLKGHHRALDEALTETLHLYYVALIFGVDDGVRDAWPNFINSIEELRGIADARIALTARSTKVRTALAHCAAILTENRVRATA